MTLPVLGRFLQGSRRGSKQGGVERGGRGDQAPKDEARDSARVVV